MKVFFASQSFYPYGGGVSTYLLNLAKGLKGRGNDAEVFHLRPIGEPLTDVVQGIKVFRLPKEPIVPKLLQGYSNFKERIYRECHGGADLFEKEPLATYGYEEYHTINEIIGNEIEGLLEKRRAEIVHVHDFQLLLAYQHIPRGIPAILTWHIPFPDSLSAHLKEFLIRHMKEFDKVIFSTDEYAKCAIKAGIPKAKALVIHPFTDTGLFRPSKEKRDLPSLYGIPGGSKVILLAQRIDWKSGHLQLIRALPRVLLRIPEARLVFLGTSSMTNKISGERQGLEREVHEQIMALGLEGKVVFAGNTEYEKMPLHYHAADVVALTSKAEGFGLALIEAMACGKAVIGTLVPGISLQIEDGMNGYLVKVGDAEGTARKLIALLIDPKLRKKMGAEGARRVKAEFGMMEGIDAHHRLYKELLKEKTDWRLENVDLKEVSAIVLDIDRMLFGRKKALDKEVTLALASLGKPLILASERRYAQAKEIMPPLLLDALIADNGKSITLPKLKIEVSVNMKRQRVKGKSHSPCMMVSKGFGLKLSLHCLLIDPEKIMILSDGESGSDLFQGPGFKIAIANASPRQKLLADETMENDARKGILKAIERLKR